jgi:hypothetical protein
VGHFPPNRVSTNFLYLNHNLDNQIELSHIQPNNHLLPDIRSPGSRSNVHSGVDRYLNHISDTPLQQVAFRAMILDGS